MTELTSGGPGPRSLLSRYCELAGLDESEVRRRLDAPRPVFLPTAHLTDARRQAMQQDLDERAQRHQLRRLLAADLAPLAEAVRALRRDVLALGRDVQQLRRDQEQVKRDVATAIAELAEGGDE